MGGRTVSRTVDFWRVSPGPYVSWESVSVDVATSVSGRTFDVSQFPIIFNLLGSVTLHPYRSRTMIIGRDAIGKKCKQCQVSKTLGQINEDYPESPRSLRWWHCRE